MGWKGKAAAVVLLTMGLGAVSTGARADGACTSTCDDHHVTCLQAGKSEDGVCLPQWRQCKVTCATGPTKASVTTTQAAKMTTKKTAAKH